MSMTLPLPYTVLTVREPCRLSFLGMLGLAPGVYAYPSDLRPKLINYADRQLEALGIIKLTFVESITTVAQPVAPVEEPIPEHQVINELEMQAPESGEEVTKVKGPESTDLLRPKSLADYDGVVVLETPKEVEELPEVKKRRKAKSIALPLTRDKLDNHDQNSIDSTSGVPTPDEDSVSTENSGEAVA